MNWKGFFKPDWKKIVIFILLLNFSLIPLVCYYAFGGCGEIFIIAGFLFLLSILYDPYMIVIAIPFMIFSYLLSCLIVWIYDKKIKKR